MKPYLPRAVVQQALSRQVLRYCVGFAMSAEPSTKNRLKVAIVGGGLVGSLSASFFAQRGHEVHLYEYRDDIRLAEQRKGRSINLAMSARARKALRAVGLEDVMINRHGIPMSSRMIHNLDGSQRQILYDKKNNQSIYSVSRKYLNEALLTGAEKYPNVHLHFNHKLVSAKLEEGEMTFQMTGSASLVHERADLVVGADGAFSAVRLQMMKQTRFDFSQTYIEHGYMELSIPPNSDKEFAMKKNFLHIWPRGTFMMIALPNQDRSWTVTLFMPFTEFQTLDTPDRLLLFFSTYFPDAIPLIGRDRLTQDFFNCKPLPLVSIKCKPYHVTDKAIIIGDAAHAMVPFYGQGMNAGFEDCFLLDKLMKEHDDNLSKALPEFSAARNKDAEAICDLAVYNYTEMRDLVNRRSFLLRKKIDDFLCWLLPSVWVPLYSSVTFSDMRYHQCIANKKWQDKMVHRWMLGTVAVGVLGAGIALNNLRRNGGLFSAEIAINNLRLKWGLI